MTTFTLQDLRELILASAGVTDGQEISEATADTTFLDLGYDSLALLDLVIQVQRKYEVAVSDDTAQSMTTPREAVDVINSLLHRVPL